MRFQRVGVVGVGVIGRGVVHHLAQTGHHVIAVDVSTEVLEKARAAIAEDLRLQRLYQKGKQGPPGAEVLERIRFTTSLAELSTAQFVVENAPERWELKRQLHLQLDAICPDETPFAANTSCIPITRLGGLTRRPERVVGMHFMNPVPLKPVVEVIRGRKTSDQTLDDVREFLAQQGKQAIVVNDSPGFVSNRVLMLTINEAVYLLQEQVARPKDIDRIFTTCFGHKMGPLETGDLIGLDTILYSLEVLYDEFCDSKYRPCTLLKSMVDAGWLGRKSGKGFYDYAKRD